MDGIHDLGGLQGFGRVKWQDESEPVFHGRWEAVVFAIMQAGARAGAFQNVDRFRHAIERIEPSAYLTHGYYGRWLGGMETLLLEAGMITRQELAEQLHKMGLPEDFGRSARPKAKPDAAGPAPATDGNRRAISRAARFARGERVRTLRYGKSGHTRLPAYARDCPGQVAACHGGWVFPDTNAHGLGEEPQYLYTVRFGAADLFGPEADPAQNIHLDLFEPYLLAETGAEE